MFNDQYADSLLKQGIIEAKAGLKVAARKYLERAMIADPGDLQIQAEANFWLSEIEDDPGERRKYLDEVLSINPAHAQARRALAILNGTLKKEDMINPDALPQASGDPTNVDADRFMCKNCGARMVFAPDGQTLICEHCQEGQVLGPGSGEAAEQDFIVAMATAKGHRKPVSTQVFHCEGCGAEFVLAPGTLSATCAYCASPHVISLEQLRDLVQPEGILPHKFNRAQATQSLVDWAEKNQVEPDGKVEPPRGLYMPVWTFDIGGHLDCYGEEYDDDDSFSLNASSQYFSKVRRIHKEYPVFIDDLLIPASEKLVKDVTPLLDSYVLAEVQVYDPRFLADWPVEVYDVPMADASIEARSQANARHKERAKDKYDYLRNFSVSSANISISSFKLILLPLWMTNIPLGDQEHLWLLNGQTGQAHARSLMRMIKSQKKKSRGGLANFLGSLLDE